MLARPILDAGGNGSEPEGNTRTSFRDLGKGQARAALQVDIVRVDESAQGSKGLAREEIGFRALRPRSAPIGIHGGRKWRMVRTFSRYCKRSATASRSFSASTFSYRASRDLPRRRH